MATETKNFINGQIKKLVVQERPLQGVFGGTPKVLLDQGILGVMLVFGGYEKKQKNES
jgi:hypothetical protein